MGPVRQALADAQLSPKQIEEVVLVGGNHAHTADSSARRRNFSIASRTRN